MYTEYKAINIGGTEHYANALMDRLNKGWVIVDKLPHNAVDQSTVYQWYILGRNEAAKQLFEKSN